jgi:hypothetical protein
MNGQYTTNRYGILDGRPVFEEATWLAVPDDATSEDIATHRAFQSAAVSELIAAQHPMSGAHRLSWWLWLGGVSELVDDPTNGIVKAWQDDAGVHYTVTDDAYWVGPVDRKLRDGVELVDRATWVKASEAWLVAEEARRTAATVELAAANKAALAASRKALEAALAKAPNEAARNKLMLDSMYGKV